MQFVAAGTTLCGITDEHSVGAANPCLHIESRSDLPGIGQRDGIWYALGCNGSGVALMPYLGHKVALQLLARQEGKTAFDDIPFTAVPFYNGNAWFRPLMTWWFRARDALRGR